MKEDEKENLDEEIESAVDSLFVEMGADGGLELEGSQKEIAERAEPIPDISFEVMEESFPEQAEPIPDITPEVMEEPLERGEPAEAALELEPIREETASVPEAEPIPDITPEVMEEPLERGEPAEAALELEPIREEIPPSPAETKPIQKPPEEEKLPKGLETLEVEILSLEWEFSPEILKKIIAALGGLKATYP
jgi:hypothetical protein